MKCEDFRFYKSSVLAVKQPYGCHCSVPFATCPFQTCTVKHAWEDACLDPQVVKLGFRSLSHSWQELPKVAPTDASRYISMCLYWLPTPDRPTFPSMKEDLYRHLPVYATLHFEGTSLQDCQRNARSHIQEAMINDALLAKLGEAELSILTLDCGPVQKPPGPPAEEDEDKTPGSLNVVVHGEPDVVDRVKAKVAQPSFCVDVYPLGFRFGSCMPLPMMRPMQYTQPVFYLPLPTLPPVPMPAAPPMPAPFPAPMASPIAAPFPTPIAVPFPARIPGISSSPLPAPVPVPGPVPGLSPAQSPAPPPFGLTPGFGPSPAAMSSPVPSGLGPASGQSLMQAGFLSQGPAPASAALFLARHE